MLYDICNQILEIDKSIRFAGFANNMGTIIAAQHREALISVEKEKEQSLLTKDELEISAIESVLRMVTRKDMIFHADSHKEDSARRAPFSGTVDDVGDDLRRIKEMGVDHVILQLTEPDMNRVIDTAKQVYKFAK